MTGHILRSLFFKGSIRNSENEWGMISVTVSSPNALTPPQEVVSQAPHHTVVSASMPHSIMYASNMRNQRPDMVCLGTVIPIMWHHSL